MARTPTKAPRKGASARTKAAAGSPKPKKVAAQKSKLTKVFAPRARKGVPHAAVLQVSTGLMWAAETFSARMTHTEAEKACRELRLLGYDDWRLPTAHELFGIVDLSRYSPAIDTDAFPDTPSSWHWTSSPVASDPGCAWIVGFSHGLVYLGDRGGAAFVRAVRGPVAASQ
jgi:hypothetical protein